MAYSLDLRKRVVHAVRVEKLTQKEAARRFQVGLWSVKDWLKRGENLLPGKPGPQNSHKLNRDRLVELVEKEPDYFLDEYAEILGSKRSTVFYNLKVLNIRRKKNHTVQREKRGKAQQISAGHKNTKSC